jgi:hypothetical protein
MPARSSQLQIRITNEQKAALKRLARSAGMTVSAYVLTQALPGAGREVDRILAELPGAGDGQRSLLADLETLVLGCSPEDFGEALADVALEGFPPTLANQVAAMVEDAAHLKGVDPPPWVDEVPPLDRPRFGWPLSSLRPHQLRVTPVPYKRRQIFFDPATRKPAEGSGGHAGPPPPTVAEPLRRLGLLGDELAIQELKVEFYFLGGAILFQAFQAKPSTAQVAALLEPAIRVREALARLAEREGWLREWVHGAVRGQLAGGAGPLGRYVELPNLAAFVPRPEYVLALKVAALALDAGPRALDDLRYVLRILNVSSAEAALEIAGRYFSERQLPGAARETLEGLLPRTV